MALTPEVIRQIEEIRHDSIHGASWLSRQAVTVIDLAARESEANSVGLFLEDLKEAGKELVETKPSMASMTNCVSRLIYDITRQSSGEKDLPALKNISRLMSRDLMESIEEAFQETAERGADLIEEGDRLITCSYSSTICQALRIARLGGKNFSVMVSESRFGDKVYGEITYDELKSYDIEAEIVADKTIRESITRADKALVGADSVRTDGSIVNGVPSYVVALAAKENTVPFYALCEKVKLDARSYLGWAAEIEEGFDLVPSHLTGGIITEEGVMNRENLIKCIKKMAGYLQVLF